MNMASSMMPTKKASMIAGVASLPRGDEPKNAVRSENTADGPRVMSFEVPKMTYTKLPRKAV